DSPVARPEGPGRLDELARPEGEALAADDAGDGGPRDEADDESGVQEAGPEERHHDEDQEERRHRHEDIAGPHEDGLHPAAGVAGRAAHGRAHEDGQAGAQEPDLGRHTAPTASRPIPGQAKTVSVRTAPPTRVGSDRPTTVTTGMRAFRRA